MIIFSSIREKVLHTQALMMVDFYAKRSHVTIERKIGQIYNVFAKPRLCKLLPLYVNSPQKNLYLTFVFP
jgi:hypothetical protein